MNSKDKIIAFVVILTWLGYITSSILIYIEILKYSNPENTALMYVYGTLSGLVGGIVSAAFGIKTNSDIENRQPMKFSNLGSYALPSGNINLKKIIGNLYVYGYLCVGISTLIIWLWWGSEASQSLANAGTMFLGMLVAIVSAYFKE